MSTTLEGQQYHFESQPGRTKGQICVRTNRHKDNHLGVGTTLAASTFQPTSPAAVPGIRTGLDQRAIEPWQQSETQLQI